MRSFIIACGIFLITVQALFAVDLSVLSFYTEPALFPFTTVVGIVEDSHDNLYFGTQSGLIKYNGVSYEKYEHIPFDDASIQSSQIQTMYMDADDVLWLGTYNGLERFDTKTGTITHYSVGTDIITAVFRDSRQRLWIGTLSGLYLCSDGKYNNFIAFNTRQTDFFIGNDTVRSVSEDSRGIVYAATYDGVWQYNEQTGAFEQCALIPHGCPGKRGAVYHFIEDSGVYWLSAWGTGLVRIEPDSASYEVFPLPDSRIYSVYNNFISNDYIAVGTRSGGIYVLNKKTKETVAYQANHTMKGILTNNIIYSLFINKYNMLFVGTADALNIADLNRISGDIAVPLSHETHQRQKTASHLDGSIACLASSPNYIWAASHNILIRYHFDRPEPEEFPLIIDEDTLTGTVIYTVSVISDTEAWIGSNKGLFRFNAETASFTPVSLYNEYIISKAGTAGLLVRTLHQDEDKTLWIGTAGAGLIHFSPQQGIRAQYTPSTEPHALSGDTIFFIDRDKSGNLWIDTNNGLCRYVSATQKFISYRYDVHNPAGISSNSINSFCEDSKGFLWFGTSDSGICRFDPKTELFRTYTKVNGLSSNQIIGITGANDGFLWIVTPKYLNLFDIEHETAQAYNIADIRQYGYFSCPPLGLKEKGLFFFGTDQEILKISQEKLYTFRLQFAPIKVRELSADGQKINIYTENQPFVFSHMTNDIKISFAAPYSSRRKKPVCAYKLIGFDKDWIIASEKNYARYIDLPAGSYTFSVKNAAEGQDTIHDSISFTIRQNFLLSPVMLWLYLLMLAFILFLLYKIRKMHWLQRYTALLEKRQLTLIQDNFTLKELSMLDQLTGIGNRRYIDAVGQKLWCMAMEHSVPIAVMMIDVDFFKKYNDTFGHQAGDAVLKVLGNDLKRRIRTETDLIGRFGGEEFLIVMYNLDSDKAVSIAEGIRKAVSSLHERYHDEIKGSITISIGVFDDIPHAENDFNTMIYRADCAVYKAKENGRNQVTLYKEGDITEKK